MAERWNGSHWTVQSVVGQGPLGGEFEGVACPSANACTAVGSYRLPTSKRFATFAERWNGTSWSVERVPDPTGGKLIMDTLSAVSCSSASACAAVGDITNRSGTVGEPLIEQWNGKQWSVGQISASLQGSLRGVACTSARACTAVGSLGDPASSSDVPLIMRSTGSAWAQTTNAVTGPGYLAAITCPSSGECTAVGTTSNGPGTQSPLIERLSGGGWQAQATAALESPYTHGVLSGVDCVKTAACTAVGAFVNSAGDEAGPLVEHSSGAGWTVQPAPNPRPTAFSSLDGVACTSATSCLAVGFLDQHPLSERYG